MNTRTTLVLAIALGALLIGYLLIDRRARSDAASSPLPTAQSSIARNLIEPQLGPVRSITIRRTDEQPWVFVKQSDTDDVGRRRWRMTAPMEIEAVAWELDRLATSVSGLKYELSYKVGEPGSPTLPEAGLDPPQTTVALEDEEGKTVTVEFGVPASRSDTYVRLADGDRIVVAKINAKTLVKERAVEYRDPQLWSFEPRDVPRVDVVDRTDRSEPTHYTFERDGDKWMLLSPVSARATDKVDEMLRKISRLRVTKWIDEESERLPRYGLDPATWTVRVSVEEKADEEHADENGDNEQPGVDGAVDAPQAGSDQDPQDESPDEPRTKLVTYELHVSEQSPLGEDGSVYVRMDEESMVATITKVITDSLKPNLTEWRDRRVTPVQVTRASGVQVTTSDGGFALVKDLGRWKFEDGSGPADDAQVQKLLSTIENLKAAAYVEVSTLDPGTIGLDPPRVRIRLSVPGVEGYEEIRIGDPTEGSALLRYVRRNDAPSIAKVRSADVEPAFLPELTFRDKTVMDLIPGRIQSVALTVEAPYHPAPLALEFAKQDGRWTMTAPVAAEVNSERLGAFIDKLATLRAEGIVAQTANLSIFGLHAPKATAAVTFLPPVQYRMEPGDEEGADDDGSAKAKTVEFQPPAETVRLLATQHEGKYYARCEGLPYVYEISKGFYDSLLAEYRSGTLLDFDEKQVTEFTITDVDRACTFKRIEGKWTYAPEPDLPLDQAKIDNLLLQLKDIQALRYVRYDADDLAVYGLDDLGIEATVALNTGVQLKLQVSDMLAARAPERGLFARLGESRDVFLLASDVKARLKVNLEKLTSSP